MAAGVCTKELAVDAGAGEGTGASAVAAITGVLVTGAA